MAIKNIETGEVTYEGRVLSISRSCDRVMSDIYADNVYATVVEDDGSLRKMWLYTNFELCTSPKRGEVDCTDAWRTFADAKRNLTSLKNEIDMNISTLDQVVQDKRVKAKNALLVIDNGDEVVVTRKSKGNQVGDTGKVFWRGTCRFTCKERYGFKSSDGKTHWVTKGSCKPTKVTQEQIMAAQNAAELSYRSEVGEKVAELQELYEIAQVTYNFASMAVH